MKTETAKSSSWRFKSFWVWAVVTVLVLTLIGFVGGKALSAEPVSASSAVAQTDDQTEPAQRCCARWARWAAKRFRDGKIRRDNGFRPGKIFRTPRKARRVFINKIERKIERQCSGRMTTTSRVPTCRIAAQRSAARNCYPASECRATELYDKAVRNSSCVTAKYPAATTGGCDRRWQSGPGLTKRQVQVLGTVVLCGSGVSAALALAPPTRGGSVVFVAFLGGASCGWGFWRDVDPG